ncbi:hypothetical protein HI914_06804 [Erysiphe necator]|nr:hypothetical protein HI914_06804 [Erysiphe necator]
MPKSEEAAILLPITKEAEFKSWTFKEATEATSTDIAKYIENRIENYDDNNIYGRELHVLWISDFELFSITDYKKTSSQTKALRNFLRSRNVFIPRTGQSIAYELLKSRLTQWQPMPDDCLHEVNEKFRPITSIGKLFPTSIQGFSRPRYDAIVNTSSQSLINLMRIYNDETKYENCDMVGIAQEDKCKAFRIMLKDHALDLYRSILKEDNKTSLETLRISIKNTFEGQEHQQMLLAKWNELS